MNRLGIQGKWSCLGETSRCLKGLELDERLVQGKDCSEGSSFLKGIQID